MRNLGFYAFGRYGRRNITPRSDPFDREYGTDTAGTREIGSLDAIESSAARYAVRYEPSSAQLIRTELGKLNIDPARFTFVDFGSGKGRVLLLAAGLPFKKIVGVEFSRQLHEIALWNIARLPPNLAQGCRIVSIHADARSFDLPKSDLICYFYNPFGPPIITQVITRLVAHHEQSGYRVIVIYHDPRHREIFENTKKFTILHETADTVVLSTV